jgi:mycothiol synthase
VADSGSGGAWGISALMLDSAFANQFVSEPATTAHVSDLFGLVSAELTAAYGFCPSSAEDVRSLLELPQGTRSAQLLVRDRDQGGLVQWWSALQDTGSELFYAWVRTHPRLPEPIGDRLSRAAWTALFDWIRSESPADRPETLVRSGAPQGDQAAGRRLREAGFTYGRTYWGMTGSVTGAPIPPVADPAVTIKKSRDAVTVHRILDEAFAGSWGYETLAFDDWLVVEQSMAGYDPDLWVVAESDGVAVAAMIMSRRVSVNGALYVQEVATAEPFRGRGIASALLRHAFRVAEAEGLVEVRLHVDSSNPHDAPALYQRAGFEVRTASDQVTCALTA